MTSQPAAVLDSPRRGAQQPRISCLPAFSTSAGTEAIELSAMAGLHLDEWQQDVITGSLGERPDGLWAAREVGLVVGRQNGKGAILECRELAGLFLFGERLILHTAHQFKTAHEGFLRIRSLVESSDDFTRRVKRIVGGNQGEMIELTNGQRLMFIARSVKSGRGFSADTVIFDEAMHLSSKTVAGLLPTQSARPNAQTWYVGSAGFPESDVLARLRARGVAGEGSRLAYSEWSVPAGTDPLDRDGWACANPGLGIRLTEESIEAELVLDPEDFARERLGLWHDEAVGGGVFGAGVWESLTDMRSGITGEPVYAIDVTPDRSRASIGVAGARADGAVHVEVIDNDPDVAWIVDRCVQLDETHGGRGFVIDSGSPAGTLVGPLTEAGLRVIPMRGRDYWQACGGFYDSVMAGTLRHQGTHQPELLTAILGARQRPFGDAWAWDRKRVGVDLTPLIAVTLAVWGLTQTLDIAPSVHFL
jgi:hypothetical protein